MMGLLVAGAFAGCAAIAWPVYLHLRRQQRDTIQVIPSLRLFGPIRKLARVSLFERIPLLVTRSLFLVTVCLLLAQPFIETARDLMLPRIDERPADIKIGVLLDDSMSSLHGGVGHMRVDVGKEWLDRQLSRLPARARVTIALTAFPHPTQPMTVKRARAFLARVKPIPRTGDATAALERLYDRLEGNRGALLVAAARDEALWGGPAEGAEFAKSATVHFLDTTDVRLPWSIESIGPASRGEGNGWVCDLLGNPEDMEGGELVAERNDGRQWRYRITPADAARRRANLLLPRETPPCWYTVRGVSGPDEGAGEVHPWRTWHFRGERAGDVSVAEGAAIVRPRTRHGFVADKVITAALQATYPETAIRHLDADATPEDLSLAGAVVTVGGIPPGGPMERWIRSCLAGGGRVLCLPGDEGASSDVETGSAGVLPAWGRALPVIPATVLPLKQPGGTPRIESHVDDYLVRGLGEVQYQSLCEPRFTGPEEVSILTADDRPFLTTRQVGDHGRIWALAASLSLTTGSITYHPSLPLLIRRTLFERVKIEQTAFGEVQIGQTVDLLAWFGVRAVDGVVTFPDRKDWRVRSPAGLPVQMAVSLPGPHVLTTENVSRVRVANYPRPARDESFSRGDWAARRPDADAVWLAPADDVGEEFAFIGDNPHENDPRRYDVSPYVMPVIAGVLLIEALLLAVYWRGWTMGTGKADGKSSNA